jgi:hypothetical protein
MLDVWNDTAAWVQAVGTVAAVLGAAWVAQGESRKSRQREEQAREEALEREQRAQRATRIAALNLAILAATQIRELHALLRDETRRGRLARVSPSLALGANERQLIAFPIQSLNDADAMVAFAYFPGALAMASEVYANLEDAVRSAANDEARAQIFAEYDHLVANLDRSAHQHLAALKQALGEAGAKAVSAVS